jgi:glycosyltransferase involved in cell wall biosynthesis
VAEAYSYGIPVVASDIGSLKELVLHDETGLLFQSGNPDNLKSMIDQLKNDNEKLYKYRKNAFNYYQTKLSPKVIYSRVMDIYNDVLN